MKEKAAREAEERALIIDEISHEDDTESEWSRQSGFEIDYDKQIEHSME